MFEFRLVLITEKHQMTKSHKVQNVFFNGDEQEYQAGYCLRAVPIDNDGVLAMGTDKYCLKPNTCFYSNIHHRVK